MIFGINTTSDISKKLYVISRAVRPVKFETILKYHEWYFIQNIPWDQVLRKVNSVVRLPDRARTLGTRLFVSPDTWDQVLRNVPSVDRVPNRARTLGTGLFVSPDTWDQVLRILSQFSL